MKFLRNLLASILGSMIGVFLLFFLMIMFFVAIGSMSESEVIVKKNSVLTLDFTKTIKDRGEKDDPFASLGSIIPFAESSDSQGLNDILFTIEKAKDDDNIKGIVLKAPMVNSNFGASAVIKEIRAKLIDFKTTGKFVYAYNKLGYSQKGYWLASVADKVFMHPLGGIMLNGFGGTMSFYPDMFKKVGVEPQIIRHGKFKAAVEPFMLKEMSPENREQTMKYVGSLWNQFLADVSESRGIATTDLNKLADGVVVRNPETALENKLVDALYHPDEFEAFIKEELDIEDEEDDIEYISLAKYKDAPRKNKVKTDKKNAIAIIYAEGSITDSGSDNITPKLTKTIEKVRKDDDIKAVVFRINSPGGSALVSEYILREMKLLKAEKPVIVSFGNVAASGGYYIAVASDTIVAEPTTITGSIGVFGMLFSGEELIKDKIGIHTDTYGTNPHANFGGMGGAIGYRKLTAFERNIIQQGVEDIYDVFITHVAEGRNLTKEQVDEIGQGRVWIGEDAKKIGLVDVFGGLEDAIRIAKEKIGIEGKARIYEYPKQKEAFEELLESFGKTAQTKILKGALGKHYEIYEQSQKVMSYQGYQALLPYELEIE